MSSQDHSYPVLQTLYRRYLENEDTAAFIRAVSLRYTVSTLERLATFGSRITRRSAMLALGFLADYQSNAVLGRALGDEDRGVRLIAENAIQSIWERAGSEPQRRQLTQIIRSNGAKQYKDAVEKATQLIEQAPWFAEAWNQRGIAFFELKRYSEAIRDCHQALELNPYHFSAATGMGHCYLKVNDPSAALQSFRRALQLNPNLEGVRAQVTYLERTMKEG